MGVRLSRLERALKGLERQFKVHKPKKGSHWKVEGPDGHKFPIPAHNGKKTEIADFYVRRLCRKFDIDYEKLKQSL